MGKNRSSYKTRLIREHYASSSIMDRQSSQEAEVNILIVDDTPVNLRLLSELLANKGYEVRAVTSGAMALTVVQSAPPELILLDIRMPEMDGFEVCQQLKADPSTCHIPVIFISALDEVWDKLRGFSVGAVDYITKPFQVIEVLARVEAHLSLRRLQQQLQEQNQRLQLEVQRRMKAESELRDVVHQLKNLARLDGLTEVANRRGFDERLDQEWRRLAREQLPLSLILCDVDCFKRYNDAYGHQAGDECLRYIASTIQNTLKRSADMVARYGGEEFVVILPNTSAGNAIKVAEEIQENIRALALPHPASPISSKVTLSFGVASTIPVAGTSASWLLTAADQALYRAKEEGRDRIATQETLFSASSQ